MHGRKIGTADEMSRLSYGTVLASPNYTDAMSVVPGPTYRGETYGYLLLNVATRHTANLAEFPEFLPAFVVYEHEWPK